MGVLVNTNNNIFKLWTMHGKIDSCVRLFQEENIKRKKEKLRAQYKTSKRLPLWYCRVTFFLYLIISVERDCLKFWACGLLKTCGAVPTNFIKTSLSKHPQLSSSGALTRYCFCFVYVSIICVAFLLISSQNFGYVIINIDSLPWDATFLLVDFYFYF